MKSIKNFKKIQKKKNKSYKKKLVKILIFIAQSIKVQAQSLKFL